jgi:hypothetical protein
LFFFFTWTHHAHYFFTGAKGGTMRAATIIIQGLAWLMITMLFIPHELQAQSFEQPAQEDKFRQEELDQMLAPIALYPDSLISQILMASTYPLEVVQAQRWVKRNKTLTGSALDDALKEKPWDPSIKSLCHFPDVLFAMSDNLEQTSRLGDAFLSQNDDVMLTIQRLRQRAEIQGNLITTKEQQVIHEEDTIRIEPAARQVVYVPLYDPLYVYGPWWYPEYPPHYWHHPSSVIKTRALITFRTHFFIGINFFSWSWVDWHRHHIYIDVRKAKRFHRFRHRHHSRRYFWRHNPVHRRGVAYRNKRIRERFGQKLPRRFASGAKMRGSAVRHHKRRAIEPSRNYSKRRKPVDMFRVRIEPKRMPQTKTRWKKVTPDVKIRSHPGKRRQKRAIEPSRNHYKRRNSSDVSRLGTKPKKIQRTEKRWKRARMTPNKMKADRIQRPNKYRDWNSVREARPERKKIQRPQGRISFFNSVKSGNLNRKVSKGRFQSRQKGDIKYRGSNLRRQGRGFRGGSGT